MVGPSGSGKSSAWRVLLKALERMEGVEGVAHVINPKVFEFFSYLFIHLFIIYSCIYSVFKLETMKR